MGAPRRKFAPWRKVSGRSQGQDLKHGQQGQLGPSTADSNPSRAWGIVSLLQGSHLKDQLVQRLLRTAANSRVQARKGCEAGAQRAAGLTQRHPHV